MKKTILSLFLIGTLLLAGIPAFAGGKCCYERQCQCAEEQCCKDGQCACKGDCCKDGECNCKKNCGCTKK